MIAHDHNQYESLLRDRGFEVDWQMRELVDAATAKFGSPSSDWCFCLKIPAVLGGAYDVQNFGVISRAELIAASGDIARQIDGLPEGTKVKFRVV